MPDPTKYQRGYSFSGFQATNPRSPLPAPQLDGELANIQTSIALTVDALKQVRRSDGALQNGIVGPDNLSPALNLGFRPRGQWVQGDSYNAGDSVARGGFFYTARFQHEATFDNRPDGGQSSDVWLFMFSVSTAVGNMLVADYDPQFKTADVYDADNHDDGEINKVFTAAERVKLAGIEAGATATPYLPAGIGPLPWSGGEPPAGWLLCDGKAYSRTTYAALFAAIGTKFGAGNGTTTFNVPKGNGRTLVGRDDMGGTSANVLPSKGSAARTVGATFGVDRHTLSLGEMPNHGHPVIDPGHAHSYEDFSVTGGTGYAGGTQYGATTPGKTTSASGTGISVGAAGENQPHDNVQPSLVVDYIIKA